MKNYDFKALFIRIITAAFTGFLAAFSKSYVADPSLTLAVNMGLQALVQWAVAGAGLHQLIYQYSKNEGANKITISKLDVN